MAFRPYQDAVRSVLYDSLRSLSLSIIDLLYSWHFVPTRTLCDPFSTTHSALSLSIIDLLY